jgi:hypothetical protein
MADDVADWTLLQQKDVVWSVDLVAKRKARILEKGDYFILNDVFASLTGLKWRVLSIQEVPYSQNYNIQAIQYIAP